MLSAFINGMCISGNTSRSSLNYNCGGQTRFAAIFSALIVAVFLYSLGGLVAHIPLASLAALLLYTAGTIVNPKQFFLCIKATGSDAFVLWLTMLSCIFLSLDVAFYIGVVISVTLYLKKAAVPHVREYEVGDDGELRHIDSSDPRETHKQIRVIKVEGELFFGAADLFQTTLKTIAEDDISTRVIILQLKNARDIDATACLALNQLHDYLIGSGRYLIACGLTWQSWEVLSASGMIEVIGKENLFVFDERHPHEFMQRALARARELTAFHPMLEHAPPEESVSADLLVEIPQILPAAPIQQEGEA
jgi:SulP family sulfate permease